jgi:hypothetical protein
MSEDDTSFCNAEVLQAKKNLPLTALRVKIVSFMYLDLSLVY